MFFMLNMKAFVSLLLLTAVAAEKVYDTECPPEQADDWTIEKLLRHEDCDKFYKCTFGKPVVMLCPSDLWFNLDAWQCDYPHNVNCSGRNEPTLSTTDVTTPIPENTPTLKTTISTTTVPTTSTSTTTAKTTTTENVFSENGCPVNPHVHWLLPHETDCNLFFHCVWGEKVLRECPKSLHFNKVTQVCDFSYRAGCSKSFDKNARRRREILTNF